MITNYRARHLTAETTEAELLAPVESLRDALAKRLTENCRSEDLANYVNQIASAEGQAFVAGQFVRMLANGRTCAEAALACTSHVLGVGPDDTWSGRTNDARRAHFDGMRKMAVALAEMVEFESETV